MTPHPDEQARELIRSKAWQDADWPADEERLIAALLARVRDAALEVCLGHVTIEHACKLNAEARLAEAEWWAQGHICENSRDCPCCQRIASLKEEANAK